MRRRCPAVRRGRLPMRGRRFPVRLGRDSTLRCPCPAPQTSHRALAQAARPAKCQTAPRRTSCFRDPMEGLLCAPPLIQREQEVSSAGQGRVSARSTPARSLLLPSAIANRAGRGLQGDGHPAPLPAVPGQPCRCASRNNCTMAVGRPHQVRGTVPAELPSGHWEASGAPVATPKARTANLPRCIANLLPDGPPGLHESPRLLQPG